VTCLSECIPELHYDEQPASPTAGFAAVHRDGLAPFASNEGRESGGLPVGVQSKTAYDGQPASPTAGVRGCGSSKCVRFCWRATKEANLAGCLSECNPRL
jgi:hypothetical protein